MRFYARNEGLGGFGGRGRGKGRGSRGGGNGNGRRRLILCKRVVEKKEGDGQTKPGSL